MVVIGRKGSGKSTLLSEVIAERPRVVVIDSMAEYGEPDKPVPGLEICWDEECVERIAAASHRRAFRISARTLSVDEGLELIDLSYALAADVERLLLVIEETSLYVSTTRLPDEIAQLVRYGRHRELDLIFVARRPSELHRDLTANADLLVTFQTQEPRDLDYLRSFYGDEALTLPALPPYQIRVFGDLSKAPLPVLHRLAAQND